MGLKVLRERLHEGGAELVAGAARAQWRSVMSATPEATSPKPSPLASPNDGTWSSRGYEEITRKFLEVYSRSGLAMLRYGPQTKVIDVACGPGTTSLLLAPAVRHVTCLDFSAGMLAQLRRRRSGRHEAAAPGGGTARRPMVSDRQGQHRTILNVNAKLLRVSDGSHVCLCRFVPDP